MAIKKPCLPLVLALSSLLFLASFAVAYEEGFDDVSPQRELEQCRSRCREQQPQGQQRQLCEWRCEERMRERHDDEFINLDVSPEREYEQCRSQCQQQRQGPQRQQCEQRCEQRRRERQERERGRRDDLIDNLDVSPEREFEQCRSQCQQQRQGPQRQQCEQRCEQRRRERQERERGRRDELISLDVSPQREYEQCRSQCQQQQGPQRQQCEQRCEQRRREREERERGRRDELILDVSPEREYEQCRSQCQQQRQGPQRQQCEQRCEQRRRERQERERESERRRRDDDEPYDNPREWEEREPRTREEHNPYHFSSQRLQSRFRTDEGHLKVLEKLSTRSELLKGIKNYRIVVLEASPNTFVVPHHCDADTVLVVTKGKGTISVVRQNDKERHNIERSDVVIVRAGSTVYLVNHDHSERLQVTKLVTPVNVPGEFEEYYPGGGEIPQSYFNAFSSNILKQSLSATEEQIERLLGEQRQGQPEGQRQGIIKRASREQLKALSQHATSPRRKGRDTSGPISLQNQSPLYSNNYGKFHQVNPEDNKHLEDLDVLVNWCEIKSGSMMVPHFNSKATVLVAVVEGGGRMEMACPHLAREGRRGREEETGRLEKVSARLSPGDIFVIPAGHPIAVEASEGQNLRMVGFGVNARNNERIFIAGKDNMIKQLEREAQELAFNMPGREVEQIFNQPKLSYFVPQDQSRSYEREEEHKTHPLESILNLAGFA